jgi:hypothetical protein
MNPELNMKSLLLVLLWCVASTVSEFVKLLEIPELLRNISERRFRHQQGQG